MFVLYLPSANHPFRTTAEYLLAMCETEGSGHEISLHALPRSRKRAYSTTVAPSLVWVHAIIVIPYRRSDSVRYTGGSSQTKLNQKKKNVALPGTSALYILIMPALTLSHVLTCVRGSRGFSIRNIVGEDEVYITTMPVRVGKATRDRMEWDQGFVDKIWSPCLQYKIGVRPCD